MPLGHSGYFIPVLWLVWAMFLGLILLAALFVQVLHWESQFQANKKRWLLQLQTSTKRLRLLRRYFGRLPEVDPLNWIQPLFRGVGVFGFWALRIVLAAKLARP